MSMLIGVDISFEIEEVPSIKIHFFFFLFQTLGMFGEGARILWQFILFEAHGMITLGFMGLRTIGFTLTTTSWVLKNH